jgi:hypothetical protein
MAKFPGLRFLLLLVSLAGVDRACGDEAPSRVIKLGELPLLFVDDTGVASRTGLVPTIHAAKTHGAPVLEPDRPWEGERVYVYGSVHRDAATGGYRMWYMGVEKLGGGIRALLALSPDGLQWTKPTLGLQEFAGTKDNNILLNANNPNVIVDSFEKDPAKRYKMMVIRKASPISYLAYHSADGLTWTEYPGNPVFQGGDTLALTQDPTSGEYLLYHKRDTRVIDRIRRTVFVTRSPDFVKWSAPRRSMMADAEDDKWGSQDPEHTQYYCMSVYAHAAGFIGLPTRFHLTTIGKRGPGHSGQDGPLDVVLVSSADGEKWQRTWPRVKVIPRGEPGTFDGGGILGVTNTAVHAGDETWVYYTAMTTGHGGTVGIKRLTIGRAAWRRHGFASLDADPAGGRVETKPMQFAGPGLAVNADCGRGRLRVALLEADGQPIPGHGLEESAVLHADAIRWKANWKGQSTVPTDRPVRVVIELTSGRLYSLSSGTAAQP